MTAFLKGRRLLIVEDEMLVLMQIETVLEELGCVVYAAADVAKALHLFEREQFDAAIIDVNLGEENSYPIADALAKRGTPFAFSTGYGDHGERIDFAQRPILKKPYVRAALIDVCRQLLVPDHLPGAAYDKGASGPDHSPRI